MKIQCNACEAAEATVMCCADEAALCWSCDEKVHAANKLASKHQRVPLFSAPNPSRVPKCDICQEASGYFFCLEDRALFCRNCDVAVHTANSYVSAHRRFLLTGVQVGLEPTEPVSSFAKEQPNSAGRVAESPSVSLPKGNTSMSFTEANEGFYGQVSTDGVFGQAKSSFSGVPMSENLPDWPLEDFFGFTDFSQNYCFTEQGSSKADSGKFGSSEGSPPCFTVDEAVDADECLGQVPEMPSPPTASGLHWQRNLHYPASEHAAFVPDISSSENFYGYQPRTAFAKRRRPC